jgi:F0F1-type ATP synthase alpha subunit
VTAFVPTNVIDADRQIFLQTDLFSGIRQP